MPHLHAPIVDEGNLIVLMHHPDKLPGQGFPGTGGVFGILNQLQGAGWPAVDLPNPVPAPTLTLSPLRPQLEPQSCPLQTADVQGGDKAHILGQTVYFFLNSRAPTALVIHSLLMVIISYQVYFCYPIQFEHGYRERGVKRQNIHLGILVPTPTSL